MTTKKTSMGTMMMKPAAANFYPLDASKSDIERWLASLPEGERAKATGFFSVIRRLTCE